MSPFSEKNIYLLTVYSTMQNYNRVSLFHWDMIGEHGLLNESHSRCADEILPCSIAGTGPASIITWNLWLILVSMSWVLYHNSSKKPKVETTADSKLFIRQLLPQTLRQWLLGAWYRPNCSSETCPMRQAVGKCAYRLKCVWQSQVNGGCSQLLAHLKREHIRSCTTQLNGQKRVSGCGYDPVLKRESVEKTMLARIVFFFAVAFFCDWAPAKWTWQSPLNCAVPCSYEQSIKNECSVRFNI